MNAVGSRPRMPLEPEIIVQQLGFPSSFSSCPPPIVSSITASPPVVSLISSVSSSVPSFPLLAVPSSLSQGSFPSSFISPLLASSSPILYFAQLPLPGFASIPSFPSFTLLPLFLLRLLDPSSGSISSGMGFVPVSGRDVSLLQGGGLPSLSVSGGPIITCMGEVLRVLLLSGLPLQRVRVWCKGLLILGISLSFQGR